MELSAIVVSFQFVSERHPVCHKRHWNGVRWAKPPRVDEFDINYACSDVVDVIYSCFDIVFQRKHGSKFSTKSWLKISMTVIFKKLNFRSVLSSKNSKFERCCRCSTQSTLSIQVIVDSDVNHQCLDVIRLYLPMGQRRNSWKLKSK